MKNRKYRQDTLLISALAITLLFTFSIISSSSSALIPKKNVIFENTNQTIPYLNKGIYIIVGAFQIPENAIKYAKSIKVKGKSPRVGRYKGNGLYYVYAYATRENLEYARGKRTELRTTSQFYNAWILYVGITLEDLEKENLTPDIIVLDQPKEITPEKEQALVVKNEPATQEITPSIELGNDEYNFRFNVISATTLKEVPGYITIIDASRNKAMRSISTNQIHTLNAPKSQSKEIIALCDIFGYVKTQVKFKIDDPMSSPDNSLFGESGGITTIRFDLNRHKVGEFITMYNVYFYNNSAIMKPESKFELNSLLGMLKENEKLEIMIHGHTNGNASGKVIKLKNEDNNFFQITADNDEGNGSAKELSKERAGIIQKWLIEQGIDKSRMALKGWGGKKMLYKKTDKLAGRNVRVEIELLKG